MTEYMTGEFDFYTRKVDKKATLPVEHLPKENWKWNCHKIDN